MAIQHVYLGTWLPRTSIHLTELFNFTKNTKRFPIADLRFNNNESFDSVTFDSGGIKVAVTEDGVITISAKTNGDLHATISLLESFYLNKFGPALGRLFGKGAPLPQTLAKLDEVYPRILIGNDIFISDAEEIFLNEKDQMVSRVSNNSMTVYYGLATEILDVSLMKNQDLDSLVANIIFTRSYSDLLRRYLESHRKLWTEISVIKESKELRYKDFSLIRGKILDFLKTISFIKTRLSQMKEILMLRKSIIPAETKKRMTSYGLDSFDSLEASSLYFLDLWQMTADYANSTLALFQSVMEENSQRELRLLQQITVVGVLVGFFGMNIAFPWEERWPMISSSSFMVVGLVAVMAVSFYLLIRRAIHNRYFNITASQEK